MFDKLVESSKESRERRRGRYLVVTTMIYTTALFVSAIATIISFNPVLGKEYLFFADTVAPPPYEGPPVKRKIESPVINTAPPKDPPPILINKFPPTIDKPYHQLIESDRYGVRDIFPRDYREGDTVGGSGEPPPPPPRPKPTIAPPPASEMKPEGAKKVSEGVLQGSAVRRKIPPYPELAKRIKASGPVQVLVTISEEGRVIEATALNGHPALRQVAVDAALQWLFSPTTLSRVPVKVQGVLTFNFVL